jgi:hypothetical protein
VAAFDPFRIRGFQHVGAAPPFGDDARLAPAQTAGSPRRYWQGLASAGFGRALELGNRRLWHHAAMRRSVASEIACQTTIAG